MLLFMRTTLTIEDDVAVRIERLRAEQRISLKDLVNAALRHGLDAMEEGDSTERPVYRTATWTGRPRITDLDNVAEVLATLDGEDCR